MKNIFTIYGAFAVSINNIELLITVAWNSFDIDEIFIFTSLENTQVMLLNLNKPIKPKSLRIIT